MNQFSKITKASLCVLLFSAMKASCYIGNSGKSTTSILQSDAAVELNTSSNAFSGIENLNDLAERFSDHFVNNVVSTLQTDSASFIESNMESEFNFKQIAKEQAKGLLKELLKASLEPIEITVAESVSPPTLNHEASKFAKFALKELFNKAEKFAGVNVPDSIWDSAEEEEDEEEHEEEEEDDDEELNDDDFSFLHDEDEEGSDVE